MAKAFFGIAAEEFQAYTNDTNQVQKIAEELALKSDEIILDLKRVDWSKSIDVPKKMIFLIGDYIIDHIRDTYQLKISFQDIDKIAERMVEVAKIRYK